MSESVFHVTSAHLANLAAIMRRDANAMRRRGPVRLLDLCPPHTVFPAGSAEDARNDFGIPIFLPADPSDCRPELDALVNMAREGCRGVIDLADEDWRVVCDELCYQIARHLAKNETIKLPSLGTLDIAYGEHGPIGRLTLAPEARP